MVRPADRPDHRVVDLISDNEHDGYTDDEVEFFDAHSVGEPAYDRTYHDLLNEVPEDGRLDIDEREVIDLTAVPDVDVPPSDLGPHAAGNAPPTEDRGAFELVTERMCLQLVLDVFPDISIDHVLTMIQERTTDLTRTKGHSERIVNELLEKGAYPKEAESASKKRRRADSEGFSDYEKDEHDPEVLSYATDAIALLKDEFLNVPARHIDNTFKQHKTLFKSYIVLEQQLRTYQQIARTFAKLPRSRNQRGTEVLLIEQGSQLPKELRAAKNKTEYEAAKRRKVEEMTRAEEANFRRAQMSNEMGECQCCFTEHPLNRMISCSGTIVHFFCKDCPKQYIETEMGQSRCRPKCFASTDCKGTFSRTQLQQILDQKTFERLEHMQQQQDLAAAGLDFLSECPFCDYKAECPPIEVDKEFRCQNKKCAKTSCRLCNKETHIPLSCKEAKKEDHITLRHVVEEAMSAALIRKCNNCQQPFVKDYGCNKMSCSHCGNKQCYICSKNVNNYDHFGDPDKGRCPLHNNVEDVHEQAVKRAADEAMAKVRVENPELSQADLMVQVSDRVKQAEAARRERADGRLNEFPYEMLGDQLAHRPGFPRIPPPPQPGPFGPDPDRAPHQLNNAVGVAYNGAHALLVAQNQNRIRMLRQYPAAPVPFAPTDQGLQAAQNRAQQQLRDADPQVFQAAMNRINADREARYRRAHAIQQRYREIERLRRVAEPPGPGEPPVQPAEPGALPSVGHFGPVANPFDAGAAAGVGLGAGLGAGVPFGGPNANRAIRHREMNNWFNEQLRNLPRH